MFDLRLVKACLLWIYLYANKSIGTNNNWSQKQAYKTSLLNNLQSTQFTHKLQVTIDAPMYSKTLAFYFFFFLRYMELKFS